MADKKIRLLVQAEVKKAVKALNKIEKEQKDIKKQNDGLKKSFKAIGGAIALAFSVKLIAGFLKEAIQLSAQTKSLEKNFRALGKGVGFSGRSLNKFRKATNGTVSDIDLMKQANNAMLLGIVESDDQFSELIDNAQRLAKAVGQDAAFGIESLTTGIGRQSKLMLDNLGIVINTQGAYDTYAESIGKNSSELTENERKQAFIAASMESVKQKVAELGEEQMDANDHLAQASVAFGDLKQVLAKDLLPLIPTITEGFLKAYKAVKNFFLGFSESPLETAVRELKELGGETLEYELIIAKVNEARFAGGKALVDQEAMIQQQLQNSAAQSLFLADAKVKATADSNEQQLKHIEHMELLEKEELERLMTQFELLKNYNQAVKTRVALEEEVAAAQADPGGEDPAAITQALLEQTFITEEQKTAIIQAFAEQRKQIQADEQLGEVPMKIFEDSINMLKITEESKTRIIKAEEDRRRKIKNAAHKEEIENNLKSAILQGQNAKEAALSVIKAEIAEAQASLISSIMQRVPFPLNLALAAGAGGMIGKVTDQLFSSFATGGSFITKGRTTLPIGSGVMVGDNASGMERVDVTPLPAPNTNEGNITININAPVVDEYVVDSIIPAIERARKLNL